MIALSLGRCKPFFDGAILGVPCVNRTGPGKLESQPRPAKSGQFAIGVPQCPVSDGRPSKCGPLLCRR
jgi:hypothetical protein